MIIGIGSDITDIRRIEKSLKRFGERFEKRCFTEGEQQKAHSRNHKGNNTLAATYAKRFAAKEACAKALGTGIFRGVAWKEIEVINLPSGQPTLKLHGNAARKLTLLARERETHIHVTLCDEQPYAQAFVVIETV